jgi:hypothetical protein
MLLGHFRISASAGFLAATRVAVHPLWALSHDPVSERPFPMTRIKPPARARATVEPLCPGRDSRPGTSELCIPLERAVLEIANALLEEACEKAIRITIAKTKE